MTDAPDNIHTLVRHMNIGLLVVDAQLVIRFWNRFLEIHSGLAAPAVLGKSLFDSFPEVNRPWLEHKVRSVFMLRNFSFTSWRDRPYLLKFAVTRPATGGSDVMRQDCTFIALRKPDGRVDEVAIVIVDVTENFLAQQALDAAMLELRQTHEQLHREVAERQMMEVELRKSQRLEAVEHLAGGVAHEINTPLQVISSATSFLREGFDASLGLIDSYATLSRAAGVPDHDIVQTEEAAELSFWREELPKGFARVEASLDRAGRIVQTLKAFCGASSRGRRELDVNMLVEEAVQFARPLYEGFADLQLALADVPAVNGTVGSLGQVILSLITNAAQAIEKSPTIIGERGKIKVTTSFEDGEVVVAVSDSGPGIPEAIRPRIFDLFFTTKEVGTGVGAGLSLAYATVTKEHGGKLTFTTGREGTTFFVRLPIAVSTSASASVSASPD